MSALKSRFGLLRFGLGLIVNITFYSTLLMAAGTVRAQQNRLQYRWVWVMENLQVDAKIVPLQDLMARAKKAGYNGIVLSDYKLNVLDRVTPNYFKNLATIHETARKLELALVPTVCPVGYSNGLLAHDPNLAEGLPVKDAIYVVHGRQADVETPEAERLKNGGFEAAKNDTMQGWNFQDTPGMITFADSVVKHGGSQSLRIENRPDTKHPTQRLQPTNGRIVQKVAVPPFRQMHLSCWIKTQGFETPGNIHATVLGADGRSLNHVNWHIAKTQEWTHYDTVFNSLDNANVSLYLGVWGGEGGKLWFDDAELEEAGLVNVLRRDGCPLTVRGEDGTVYKEGTKESKNAVADFLPIVDERMGMIPYEGNYEVYHTPPAIHLAPNSRIREGQRLRVSFYHSINIYEDQVCSCISEPKIYSILKEQIDDVEKLLHPSGFFMSHDEFRVANWCAACQARKLTPGQMLADNVRRCAQMARAKNPKAELFFWSDMFDPYHNAADTSTYYLVNGSWKGSWEGLPHDAVIVNWNPEKAKDSLAFFAKLGNPQILAGYYDGDPNTIKQWLAVGKDVKDAHARNSVVGVMYTTWTGNYQALETFAKAAWGQ